MGLLLGDEDHDVQSCEQGKFLTYCFGKNKHLDKSYYKLITYEYLFSIIITNLYIKYIIFEPVWVNGAN